MPYSLLYDTPKHGLLMTLYEEPTHEDGQLLVHSAYYDTIEEIKDLFDDVQMKLNSAKDTEIIDLFTKLTFLSPLIIGFEDPDITHAYAFDGQVTYVALHNPFGLPVHCLEVQPSMKELTVVDMFKVMEQRLKRLTERRRT